MSANLGFGLVFLVAALGCVGLGWWVIRGDRINRAREMAQLDQAAVAEGHPEHELTALR